MKKKAVITVNIIIIAILLVVIVYNAGRNCPGNDSRYELPAENNGWHKYGDSPVFGDAITGTIFDPYVYLEGDSLIMFASERKTGNIIRSSSIDGIHWSEYVTSLKCRPGTWQHIVNRAGVIRRGDIWHMFYTGQSPDTSRIGFAVSEDGVRFTSNDQPVLVPSDNEGVSVMNPCVLYEDGKYKMWYAAGENYEPDVLYYAESIDGLDWCKNIEPVLTKEPKHKWEQCKVGGCYVSRNSNGVYKMYYIGYQTVDIARICEAYSSDGINWTRDDSNLLLSPSAGSWDADATYKPSVLEFKGDTLMWYNGRTEDREYIGLAVKKYESK